MSRRNTTVIILVIIVLIVVSALVYYFWFSREEPVVLENVNTDFQPPLPAAPGSIVDFTELNPVEREREMSKADLEKLASFFAERYGTYSSHSNFQNLNDLEIYMTDNMKLTMQRYVQGEKEGEEDVVYYGVETKSLVSKVTDFDEDGLVQAKISTQRSEARDNPLNTTVFYQDLILTFKKSGPKWLIEEAVWQ